MYRKAHLVEVLQDGAQSGKGIVFIHKKSEARLSYQELYDQAMSLAVRMREGGWRAGDEVIVRAEKLETFVPAFWGCVLGGFVPVPVAVGSGEESVSKLLRIWGLLEHPRLLTDERFDALHAGIGLTDKDWLLLDEAAFTQPIAHSSEQELPHIPRPDDTAFLQFSSGSTGDPKGVVLTHRNLMSNMHAIVACSGSDVRDRSLSWMPLTHDMGLIGFHLSPIYAGMDQFLMQPAQFMLDPMLWLSKVDEHRITSIASPNFGYNHFLNRYKPEHARHWDLSCVKLIFNGAEPISARLADRFMAELRKHGLKETAMFPVYGMAEASLAVAFPPPGERLNEIRLAANTLTLGEKADEAYTDDESAVSYVDVGYPVADCEAAIWDEEDRVLPERTVGHIVIRGVNVTKGYYRAPESNRRTLARDGWLRTGDVGFMRGGRLVVTGRFKDIIFIRGQNVYPHDIEQRAEAMAEVGYGRTAACGVPDSATGEEKIVLFVSHKGKLDAFAPVADAISRRLNKETGFEISRIVPIRQIPRTTSGKIQHFKLAERYSAGEWDELLQELDALRQSAEASGRTREHGREAPSPQLLRMLRIWQEALQRSDIEGDDDFQEFGGNSLRAAQVLAGVRDHWGVELPLRTLYECPTPRLLLERTEREAGSTPDNGTAPVRYERLPAVADRDSGHPVTFAQLRMALVEQTEKIGSAYHILVAFNVTGPLSALRIADVLQALTYRHETLRTSYHWERGELVQRVHSADSVSPQFIVAHRETGEFANEAALDATQLKELTTPFELDRPTHLRAYLSTDGGENHRLFLNVHHIAADGIGMNVLMKEFALLLGGAELAPIFVHYKDYAVWQRGAEANLASETYWRERLAAASPRLEWPEAVARPARRTYRGKTVKSSLPPDIVREWDILSRAGRTSIASLLLSLYGVLLGRICNQKTMDIGLILAGRDHPDVRETVGMFNNYVPIGLQLEGDSVFRELWRRTQETLWEAMAYADVPYERLIELAGAGTDPSRNPLFDAMLVYHNEAETAFSSFEAGGCRFEQIPVETGTAKLDLKLDVYPDAEGSLLCVWEYNDMLFRPETVERLAAQFGLLARTLSAAPDTRLEELELLTEAERKQVVETFNATTAPYPRDLTLPELLLRQAELAPDWICAAFEGETLTYRELNARADRIARALALAGVGPDRPVGLMAERSPEMLAGLLGILKAGGAYVPLPPDFPADRLRFMAGDAGIACLCCQRKFASLAGEVAPDAFALDLDEAKWREDSVQPLPPVEARLTPDNLAYILYTSGSTGRPKGVMIRHGSVVNRLNWMQRAYPLGAEDVIVQKTPYSFDVSVWELFWWQLAGARVAMLPPGAEKDPEELLSGIRRHLATTMHFVPTMLAAFLESAEREPADSLREKLASLKVVFASGEALPKAHADRFYALMNRLELGHVKLVNLYGPTEATVDVTVHECDPASPLDFVPIGRPIDNTSAYVLSGNRPQPIGVPGELCIAGVQLASGYANRPDLTAERFVDNPFAPGEKMYRTGDVARWMSDGQLEYLGRMDDQVKIRGYRIELGEIERVLLECEGVTEAAVTVREDGVGGKALYAYVVAERECASEALRGHCAERLPAYMVPSGFVQLGRMPLTASGKTDRKALPAPEGAALPSGTAYAAPANETEAKLVAIWEELLQRERIGAEDHFFEIGGHSLKAAALLTAIHRTFDRQLSLRDIFDRPTVRLLAECLTAPNEERQVVPYKPIPIAPAKPSYPLSSAQKRLFVLQSMDERSTAYHLPSAIVIRGRLEQERLLAVIRSLAERHETLRTSFAWEEGHPVQRVSTDACPELEFALSDDDPDRCMYDFVRPFRLDAPSLLRAKLIRRSNGIEHLLLMDMHHLIGDGLSASALAAQFSALYEGRTLAPLPAQFKDYVAWQADWLAGEEGRRQERYWLTELSGGAPRLDLPYDYARPAVKDEAGDQVVVTLDSELALELGVLGARTGSTLYMALLCAFAALLHRYSGQEEVWIGSPAADRPHADLSELVGMFVNTLVMRSAAAGSMTLRELLKQIRERTIGALDNDRYPFEELVERLGTSRDPGRNPLFDVMFVLQNAGLPATIVSDGVSFSPCEVPSRTAKFDLLLEAVETEDGVRCRFEYRTSLFRSETIERFAAQFKLLVRTLAYAPDTRLEELELLTEAERKQVVETFNATAAPYPRDLTLPELLLRQAEFAPERICAAFEDETLTYRELNARADRIARALALAGVGPDRPVGLMAERSPEMLAGLLGILKAGGAYVPLPPDFPADRLRFMAGDAGIACICCQRKLASLAGEVAPDAFALDLDDAKWREDSVQPLPPVEARLTPDNLAYILYTSGSTGRPKGVMIRHGSVVNRLNWMQRAYPLGAEDVIVQKTPYSFDVSVWELFWWQLAGARVAMLPPGAEKDPAELLSGIRRHLATTMHFVPTMLAAFLESAEREPADSLREKLASLKVVFASGEALPKAHADRFYALVNRLELGHVKLVNLYGPTEATVDVTVHECDPASPLDFVPIGRPIDNTSAYVLSGNRPQPIGVPGELCIAGVQLASGYANRPDLTAERFVDNPFAPGEKMYRTGDVARWMSDGQLEYLGRMDDQVKIRGYRIELGEIERVLLECEGVTEAAVTVREDGVGGKALYAYVVAERECASEALRGHCADRLPAYMVPSGFVQLGRMPLTASGKTDRKALPAPEGAALPSGTAYAAPANETEAKLVAIWEELLQRERIGADDHFFEIGGNSLLLIRLHKQLEEHFSVRMSVAELFAYPTVAKLARYIQSTSGERTPSAIVPLQIPKEWRSSGGRRHSSNTLRLALTPTDADQLKRLSALEEVEPDLAALGLWAIILAQAFRQPRFDLPMTGFGRGVAVAEIDMNRFGGFSELLAYLLMVQGSGADSSRLPEETAEEGSLLPLYCRGPFAMLTPSWKRRIELWISVRTGDGEWAIEAEYNECAIGKDKVKQLLLAFPALTRKLAEAGAQLRERTVAAGGKSAGLGREAR